MSSEKESALSPFKHQTFAVMWLAALISNIGTWMHSVGAGWLMTSLSPSPLIVALVQTATTLPVFVFALPAGALADIFNRRTLLLLTNVFMILAAIVFALLVWSEAVTAELLLLFTFLLGAGAAFMAPAWQAVVPSMVPKKDLPQAVALGGISINISRAVGPALAGLLISVYGLSSPFIANVISFVVIILALLWWRPTTAPNANAAPKEKVFSAMAVGLRYARYSPPLKNTMWHIMGFMFFGNAFWGLLPIISKDQLGGDATYFGLLMGAVGAGAVCGALILPRFKAKFTANQLMMLGTLGVAVLTGYFAYASHQVLSLIASYLFGLSWILVLATVNVSAQQALPDWVRARGLAVFLMVFYGSMSLGATFWGWLAGQASMEVSMLSAAIGGAAFLLVSYRAPLQQGKTMNLTPSRHLPEPEKELDQKIPHSAGPVIIQIAYRIAAQDRDSFIEAVHRMRAVRKRDGARKWGVFEDTHQQNTFIEQFEEATWGEHLRHHERMTHEDKMIHDRVLAFHQGKEHPSVKHLIATPPLKRKQP